MSGNLHSQADVLSVIHHSSEIAHLLRGVLWSLALHVAILLL